MSGLQELDCILRICNLLMSEHRPTGKFKITVDASISQVYLLEVISLGSDLLREQFYKKTNEIRSSLVSRDNPRVLTCGVERKKLPFSQTRSCRRIFFIYLQYHWPSYP